MTTDPFVGPGKRCLMSDGIQNVLLRRLIRVNPLQSKGEPFEVQVGIGESRQNATSLQIDASGRGHFIQKTVIPHRPYAAITNPHGRREWVRRRLRVDTSIVENPIIVRHRRTFLRQDDGAAGLY